MGRLTKRKALEMCRDLWDWMAVENKDSDSDKRLWPGWDKKTQHLHLCPCCEYSGKKDGLINCSRCLLKSFWTKNKTRIDYMCGADDSAYYPFENNKGTPRDALRISNACRKLLGDKPVTLKYLRKKYHKEDI